MDEHVYMTYDDAAVALGIKPASVRRRAALRKWPKRMGNDGLARVGIPKEAIPQPRETPPDGPHDKPDDRDATIAAQAVRIAELSAEANGLRDHLATAREAASRAERMADIMRQEAAREIAGLREDLALARRRWWRRG